MRRRGLTKGRAFWAGYAFLALSLALLAWRAPDALPEALGTILTALVALVGISQGTNVADNWQRSVNFRTELHQPEAEEK